jgi:hypothetical protein
MRFLIAWFILCCCLAGLHTRALAATNHTCGNETSSDHCGQTHVKTSPDEHHHDGDQCPVEHHHFGCCSHALPSAVVNDGSIRLGIPNSSYVRVRHQSEVAPDEPLLGSEKPPLI